MTDSISLLIGDLAAGTVVIVDLTQALGPSTPVIELPPVFSQSPPFSMQQISRYDDNGPAWYWNTITLGEHTGTHFDAPVHWVTGKDVPDNTCDALSPTQFLGPACVINISHESRENPDFLLTARHVQEWEAEHGMIQPGSWVLLRTDWGYRTDPLDFFNADEAGPHTPGFSRDASEFLAHERDVLGVGVETVGTDAGQAATFDPPFPNHAIMHGAGKLGLASLCNLDKLPATGSILIAAPLKIVDGSGSPVRAIALTPRVTSGYTQRSPT